MKTNSFLNTKDILTREKLLFLLSLIAFTVISIFRYQILDTVDKSQIVQIFLRSDQRLYEDYGFLFGPGMFFLTKIFSIFNLNPINTFVLTSILCSYVVSYLICIIYARETNQEKINYSLFYSIILVSYFQIGGMYNDHFSYHLAFISLLILFIKKINTNLKFFLIGIFFCFSFLFKTSIGVAVAISFVGTFMIVNRTLNIFTKKLLFFYLGGIFSLTTIILFFIFFKKYNFFYDTFLHSTNYHVVSGRKPLELFFYSLITPLLINPIQLIKDIYSSNGGLHRLILFPNVLLIYFFYYYIFFKDKLKSFVLIFLITSSILVIGIIGKSPFYYLLCTPILTFYILEKNFKDKKIVHVFALIFYIFISFIDSFYLTNKEIKKIKSISGTFYFSIKNFTFDKNSIEELTDFIKENNITSYSFTDDDLSFIPYIIGIPPAHYEIDFSDTDWKTEIKSAWLDTYPDKIKQNEVKWIFVFNGKKSIRQKDSEEFHKTFLLPLLQKTFENNLILVREISTIDIYRINPEFYEK